jgi:drug/metabolite transporter (DMT)-like permease
MQGDPTGELVWFSAVAALATAAVVTSAFQIIRRRRAQRRLWAPIVRLVSVVLLFAFYWTTVMYGFVTSCSGGGCEEYFGWTDEHATSATLTPLLAVVPVVALLTATLLAKTEWGRRVS